MVNKIGIGGVVINKSEFKVQRSLGLCNYKVVRARTSNDFEIHYNNEVIKISNIQDMNLLDALLNAAFVPRGHFPFTDKQHMIILDYIETQLDE